MPTTPTITGQTTLKYMHKYAGKPKRWIARTLYAENREIYNSEEHARTSLRYYSGALGTKNVRKSKR